MDSALELRADIEKKLAEVNASMRALRDPHPALPAEHVALWVQLYKERQTLEQQFLHVLPI